MRVAHYYHWALRGEFGTAIALRGWCSALAEHGAEVRLVASPVDARMPVPEGTKLIPIKDRPLGVQPPGYLRKRFAGADVVVLHGGWEPCNLVAAREARMAGTPYVVMPHGVYYPQVFQRRKVALKRVWWAGLERAYLRKALAIHVFFPQEVAHFESRGVRVPFVVAPNGFKAPANVVWTPSTDPYVAWLGRFDPEHKGLDLLLQALHSLPEKLRPRLRLHGVDWNGKRADVERLVEDLGLGDSTSVLDPVYGEDKWTVLAGARGFVYPSRWDASPISVVEALSIGVPTLLTPFPLGAFAGSRDAALVVEATAPAIAEGLGRLVSADAASYGERAAELVRRELSWSVVARSWLDQVTPLLESRRLPASSPR